jgi:hypothetical protein
MNADQSKAEELIKNLVFMWGVIPEKQLAGAADATGTQVNKPHKNSYKISLDSMETISKL